MITQVAIPAHFAGEFLVLVVCVGAAFHSLRLRPGSHHRRAQAEAAGFFGLALAQGLHASLVFDLDADPVLIGLRTAAFALLAFGARPTFAPSSAPAVFVAGSAGKWSAAPAVASALVLVRGAREHRKDLDPATFAFAAAFAAFIAAEVTTVMASPGGGDWLAASHAFRAVAALLLGRWLWTSIVRSIRLRFLAAFISALLILVLVISSSLSQVIARNVEQEELKRVVLSAAAEVEGLVPLSRRAVTASTTVADAESTRRAVERRDTGSLQRFATGALQSVLPDVDFLLIVDARGRRLADAASRPGGGRIARMPPEQAGPLAGSDLVASALKHQGGVTIDTAGPNLVVIFAATPVVRRSATIGAVALGYRLDGPFLTQVQRRSAAFATLLVGGEVVATTGDPEAMKAAFARGRLARRIRVEVSEAPPPSANCRPTPSGGCGTFAVAAPVGGAGYFNGFIPLRRTNDRQIVGIIALSRPATAAAITQRGTNRILFLVTLLAAAFAASIAWVFGGRITRPIRSLTHAAHRVRTGDLDARAEVFSTDEVGELGSAFNEMTADLSQLTQDLRQAAEEEASLRTQLEAIMQSMGDGLVATDAAGRIVAFNRAAERIVGREARKALGKPLGDVLRSANGDGKGVAELAQRGAGEFEILREGGGRVPVALTSSPLTGTAGRPGGRVIVFRDISREAEAERMKTEFLSNVSHELRTPLTPIKGYTEILKRKQFPREKALGFLDGILESTTRLERIVEILVDFAAMEAGRLKAHTEALDLRAFAGSAVARWKKRDAAHTFALKVPAGLPPAEADPRLLNKCIDELIDNALKFSPAGANGARRPRVEIQAGLIRVGGAQKMRLSVRDHGIGISEDQMPSIFQDFRQLDGSETRPYGGLGLGLAYAKRVVEVHNGTIEVSSRPGKGSTFSLILPVADIRPKRPQKARDGKGTTK